MSEKDLNKILNRINSNFEKAKELMFLRPLSPKVDYALFFNRKSPSQLTDFDCIPSKCYLVKNENDVYTGIVVDMQHDLHWFIKPIDRKKGYLSRALIEIILPHLLDRTEEQQITISKELIGLKNFIASERVALKAGFKLVKTEEDKCFYLLKKEELTSHPLINGEDTPMTQQRMEKLKTTFYSLARTLKMCEAEIQLHTDDLCFSEDLGELSNKMASYAVLIEDKWHLAYK